ncbi:HAD domain-containing protein [Fluviicola taffensis]|uniref:HAD domain-containing protein n=1 Tax=Fluviicola taffensis TaxID=191579 RepID=UPI003137B853
MLLLLDIDGVMVQAASWKKVEIHPDGFYQFLPNAINSLKDIISETGASIVLTTSHKSTYSLEKWEEIFINRGITATIDKLDDNINFLSRKGEILNWLSKNRHVNDFVIIDDDKSLHDLPSNLKEKVVFTQPLIGLNKEGALNAIEILNKVMLV